MSIFNSDDQEGHEENQYDDLANYEQIMEDKVFQEVMNYEPLVQDDAHQLHNINQKQIPNNKRQPTEEEKQARQLKLKNARKYFEVVKLIYLQQICQSLKSCELINKNHSGIVAKWLSTLSPKLISQFLLLKSIKPLSIKIEDVLTLIKKSRSQNTDATSITNWPELIWSIFQELKISCRKINFFDIDQLVQQLFYKLRYGANLNNRKKQNKKRREEQMIKIKIQQNIEEQLQKEQSNDYLHFQDFQFDPNSFNKSKSQTENRSQSQNNNEFLKQRRENNWIRKKNYKLAYFHVFSTIHNQWKLVNAQILQIEDQQSFKTIILQSKAIIGFYGMRILHFKPQFEQLLIHRQLKNIAVDDLTLYFYDNYKLINDRRRRVGCKFVIRHIFKKGQFWRHPFMLSNYDQSVLERMEKIQLQFQLSVFPKNKKQMITSEYFITPSSLPQYCILDPKAIPVCNQEFNEQKVYRKRNIIGVKSKNGWVDEGRKVKGGQIPVKKTENKSKNMTELYLYQQTQPFFLQINHQTGQFIADDQYNSIYVPPEFKPDKQFELINRNISFVCTKAKLRHAKLVQGFTHNVGRILPNYIGFLVYKQDEAYILQLFAERQAKLEQNKSKNKQKQLISLWNKLFKKIELQEWSQSFARK